MSDEKKEEKEVRFATGASFSPSFDSSAEKIIITKKAGKISIEGLHISAYRPSWIKMGFNGIQLWFELLDEKGEKLGRYSILNDLPEGQYSGGEPHHPPLPIREMFEALKD
ncbi:MAG: hypothetical protein ABR875_03280 [Minisyncoccia bacterium]|jgi:hypothetical protein